MPTVIILASGRGERFLASGGQGNKLTAVLGDKTVLQWTMDAVRATGLPWYLQDAGHAGMGDSIAAAVGATPASQGWLILPADLPMILPKTIQAVADALMQGAQVAYPVCAGQRGHPVGFAAAARVDLLDLKGKCGAAGILSARSAIKIIVNDAGSVCDVDTLDQLQAMQQALQKSAGNAGAVNTS